MKSQNEIFGGFKFNDKRILKAIARFTQHEKAFPNKFKRYLLCTNCGFLNTSNSSDLLFCLELLKQNNSLDDCYKRANFSKQLDQIATISKINDLDLISSVLRKTEVTQWASLRDYKIVLSAEVAKLLNAGYQSKNILDKVSEMLMQKTLAASEYSEKQAQPAYYEWISNPERAETAQILKKKRVSKEMVNDIISACMESPGRLRGVVPAKISEIPHSMGVLSQKMDEGRIREGDKVCMKDCDN